MITYSWFIDKFTVLTNHNGMANVIQTVHWRRFGMNETGVYGSVSGSTDISLPNESFIQYENLTQEFVEQWLTDTLGQNTITQFDQSIELQINEKLYPAKLTLTPPWMVE